jgi:hypothetical protein
MDQSYKPKTSSQILVNSRRDACALTELLLRPYHGWPGQSRIRSPLRGHGQDARGGIDDLTLIVTMKSDTLTVHQRVGDLGVELNHLAGFQLYSPQ